MKKIIFAIAVMAAVFASCGKEEISAPSTNEIKLDVTVTDFGSDDPATKAKIKSGWSAGDVISIYYDSSTSKSFDITYDGSKWTGPESITAPGSASGYVKCLYNGTLKVASTDSYTFSEDVLSFNIANWKFLTEIQVVLEQLSSSKAANYTLACDKFTPLSGDGYTVGSDAITASTGTMGTPDTGIANTDGVAFVFAPADYSDSEQNLLFTLTCIRDELKSRKVKGYSFNETISEGTSGIIAYKIRQDKFKETVQLWDGGPEWAYNNIGAESATDYGYHFAWGYTDRFVYSGSRWVYAAFSRDKTFDSTGFSDYASHTYSDMAGGNWGTGWKLPEKTDFDSLLSECDIEYVTTGTKGVKFTGRGDYSASSIFLPAAGYGDGSSWGDAGENGFYYSATEASSEYAYSLYFYTSEKSANSDANNKKYCGRSVRPVRDIIYFADANFKAYCLENFDTDGDGEVSPEEALVATAIDCSDKDIASLVGIEHFTNLVTLDCSGNASLTSIDVSSNTSLTTLDISSNTSLTTLTCNNGIHIVAGEAAKPLSSISAAWAYVDDVKAVFFTFNGSVRAMSADEEAGLDYGYQGTTTGASSTTDGVSNTDKIASRSPAASWCRTKGSAWYLPAKDELVTIYNNRSGLNSALTLAGGTQLEGSIAVSYYWSSTESSAYNSYYVYFLNGSIISDYKNTGCRVRAVRAL